MTWLVSVALTVVVFAVIFCPLERLVPIKRRAWRRPGVVTDIGFLLGNLLVVTPVVNLALVWLLYGVAQQLPLAGVQAGFTAWPLWLQVVVGLLLSDAAVYGYHRLSHAWPPLWRFHQCHHSAEAVDWVAAYREHPVDNLLTRVVENAPLVLLGLSMPVLAGLVMFRGLWALYIHSNIAIEPGPLRWVLGSPRLHHWHHEMDQGGRSNFANLNPLMDLVFGTYHDPQQYPDRYGVRGAPQRGYLGYLWQPFRSGAPRTVVSPAAPVSRPSRGRSALAPAAPGSSCRHERCRSD